MINRETITKIKMRDFHENTETLHSNISTISLCLCGMEDLRRYSTNMGMGLHNYFWNFMSNRTSRIFSSKT